MYRPTAVMSAKTKVPVDLLEMDGTRPEGYVFAGTQERVLDLMNGREPFLPIEPSDGQVLDHQQERDPVHHAHGPGTPGGQRRGGLRIGDRGSVVPVRSR